MSLVLKGGSVAWSNKKCDRVWAIETDGHIRIHGLFLFIYRIFGKPLKVLLCKTGIILSASEDCMYDRKKFTQRAWPIIGLKETANDVVFYKHRLGDSRLQSGRCSKPCLHLHNAVFSVAGDLSQGHCS